MKITQKTDPIGIYADDKNREAAATKIQAFVRGRTQVIAYKTLQIGKARNELNKLFNQIKKIIREKNPKTALAKSR